jgi:trans-2,3-dihydro-3-hydroxyanthranilate isomerase
MGAVGQLSDTMHRRYVTCDVFTDRPFGGNPLAVVLDGDGLSGAQMQAIATEFNYSETTFVGAPEDPAHTAKVRIFTPRVEIPFAGHPNVGTAVMLAREHAERGKPPSDAFVFEEAAGLVSIRLLRTERGVVGAELKVPKPLSILATASAQDAAECLSLTSADVNTKTHAPQALSVGLPFLVVELSDRDALRRAKPNLLAHERLLPPMGTDAVCAYARDPGAHELHVRVFAPLDGCIEDPATGSAVGATIAHLAALESVSGTNIEWRIQQGHHMGRPSLIRGRTEKSGGAVRAVYVAGEAVPIMKGTLLSS